MKRAKILLVDDSPDVIWQLTNYLHSTFDCTLGIADSGKSAIKILEQDQGFDLIVCDYQMDEGTGLVVLDFITTNSIEIPFIFYSGMAKELRSYKSGKCIAVIEKMDINNLTKSIGEVIGQEAKK